MDSLGPGTSFYIGHAHFRLGTICSKLAFSTKHTFGSSSYIFWTNLTKNCRHDFWTYPIKIALADFLYCVSLGRNCLSKLVGGAYLTKNVTNHGPHVRSTPNLNHTLWGMASTESQKQFHFHP